MLVAELLAAELGLIAPELPWHTERDRPVALAATLGITAGALSKIAQDLLLMSQSEVGEAREAIVAGKGGSSALPQKQNPVDAVFAQAAARLALGQVGIIIGAMAHEHERAAGGWQAEWQALPDLVRYTGGAAARMAVAMSGLEPDPERMRQNLEQSGGLLLAEALSTAISPQLGRLAAQQLVQTLCQRTITTGATLESVALADPQVTAILNPTAIRAALNPDAYLGSAEMLIERALRSYYTLLEK